MPENRRKKEPFRHMAEKPLLLFKCKINVAISLKHPKNLRRSARIFLFTYFLAHQLKML
ncbi:conserved domain protein [Ruminococcus albus 8]|uniref:Conserved domain protein n=1 Tax=Ruminococcus albus 8 TaxID=246199 RepID=E9SE45_RUMAL|nr:conserved domain protein [Ruminococcus albus 8]